LNSQAKCNILGGVGKVSKEKHKQFFDKINLKKLERTAYVKFILSRGNNQRSVKQNKIFVL